MSTPFPRLFRVRQHFNTPTVADVEATTRAELQAIGLGERIGQGETVAIPVGSRGIANILKIIRTCCAFVRECGGVPILIPAMGSHGGGTVAGQLAIVNGYGITEESCGADIRASMETVVIEETPQGFPVHFDANAHACDHVLIVGRVKPHTGFTGPIESGLHKMMLIGLGKHTGAKIYHRAIIDYSFDEIIRTVADVVLKRCGVVGGLAIVENAEDETAILRGVRPEEFYERECELLEQANTLMPSLPFDRVGVLIVDRIGKNISGTGLDTNVVGRKFHDDKATPKDRVNCLRIVARGLTEETHGNASGIGIADFVTEDCVSQIDMEKTRINAVTGGHPSAGAIPLTYPTDRDAIAAAMSCVGLMPPEEVRVVQIADTLHLSELLMSEVHREEIESRDDLEILTDAEPLRFDDAGRLCDVFGAR